MNQHTKLYPAIFLSASSSVSLEIANKKQADNNASPLD
jgi:hypothetical protein